MSGDLAAFIAARLDEDEAAARAVTFRSRFAADGHGVVSPGGPGHPAMPIADVIDDETAAHIARHDPARVLRDIEAKRAIVGAYCDGAKELAGHEAGGDVDDGIRGAVKALHFAVWQMAAIHAGHPDYRNEWYSSARPDAPQVPQGDGSGTS